MSLPVRLAVRQNMLAIFLLRRRRRRRMRERVFRPRSTLLGMTEEEVVRVYRFPRQVIYDLVTEMSGELSAQTLRSNPISPYSKVLAALHFFATGSFQRTSGIVAGMSQSSQSRALWQVVDCLLARVRTHIYMPATPAEVQQTVRDFYNIAHLPGVAGAVDCTHIPLQPPRLQEHLYRNRHHWHSVNVQVISDAQGIIRNVYASYPGSTHDSFIFGQSEVVAQMEAGRYPGLWLIGDAGYPQRPYCMTPVRNPTTPAQVRYNRAHRKTRNVIERVFGILKSRFRCLDRSGGTLMYTPNRVCKIVVACCILHNVAVRHRLQIQLADGLHPQPHGHRVRAPAGRDAGQVARDNIISTYFR